MKVRNLPYPFLRGQPLKFSLCNDQRDEIIVPDILAVEDLNSSKLNNKRKLARLITQYRDISFLGLPIFLGNLANFFLP